MKVKNFISIGNPISEAAHDVKFVPGRSKFHFTSPLIVPWRPPILLIGTLHVCLDWMDAMEVKYFKSIRNPISKEAHDVKFAAPTNKFHVTSPLIMP